MDRKTYAIEISDRLNEFSKDISVIGYFCGTYNSRGTFIASTTPNADNADRIMLFTSLDRAAGRVKSLIEVKIHNAYLSHMKFRVVELSDEDVIKIKEAKKIAKQDKVKREVIYTGVSTEYIEQTRDLYLKTLKRFTEGDNNYYYLLGKVEALNDVLADIYNKNK